MNTVALWWRNGSDPKSCGTRSFWMRSSSCPITCMESCVLCRRMWTTCRREDMISTWDQVLPESTAVKKMTTMYTSWIWASTVGKRTPPATFQIFRIDDCRVQGGRHDANQSETGAAGGAGLAITIPRPNFAQRTGVVSMSRLHQAQPSTVGRGPRAVRAVTEVGVGRRGNGRRAERERPGKQLRAVCGLPQH